MTKSTAPAVPAAGIEPLLEVRDLRTCYHTDRGVYRVVNGVSFELRRGETLGIVGESGCGKTALARSLMGLLPDTAESTGEVLFEGVNLLDLPRRQFRDVVGSRIAMVFQDPMTSLHPVMRIGKQITEALHLHRRMSRSEARDAAVEVLRSLHIPEPERRLRQYPHELSGGMRQRIMIAIALVCGPDLLIADEPTTALDVTIGAQVLDLLGEQRRQRDMAMILITHDLGVVAAHADHIAVMYAGKVVEQAPTRQLFTDGRMPYTAALMEAIPRLDERRDRLPAIPGRPPDLRELPAGCRFAPRCPHAQERCGHEEPRLLDGDSPGHRYACWHPVLGRRSPAADDAVPVVPPGSRT